jgi:hypothetical protein
VSVLLPVAALLRRPVPVPVPVPILVLVRL